MDGDPPGAPRTRPDEGSGLGPRGGSRAEPPAGPGAAGRARPGRLVGVDVARCLALLGMVATHVLAERRADGSLTLAQGLAGGRAAALFALLAGVSLALMTGRGVPVVGRERLARSAGIAVRALLVALVGLLLGSVGSGLAVILTHYGLLFLLGLLFVGLSAHALAVLAVLWAVGAPVLSHLVRPSLPPRGWASPTLEHLADPYRLLSELLFTGYYPVLAWLTYLLAGLAVGRLDLTARRVTAGLAALGGVLAGTATLLSREATGRPEVMAALLADPATPDPNGPALLNRIAEGLPGSTPTGGPWEWLWVVAPHSATPLDLVQTTGSAMLVLGVSLLALSWLPAPGVRAAAVLFGAGTMTFSLYTLHVLARTPGLWPPDDPSGFGWHVLLLLGIGAGYAAARRPGPLETLAATAAGRAAARVRATGAARPGDR